MKLGWRPYGSRVQGLNAGFNKKRKYLTTPEERSAARAEKREAEKAAKKAEREAEKAAKKKAKSPKHESILPKRSVKESWFRIYLKEDKFLEKYLQ